ncbi:MAG: Spy/CpxP family protein refolding chaperone [Verrucomicrobiota bacterium]
MKKRWLIPVLVAVIIGAMAYGLTRWAACSQCQPSPGRLENVSFLKRELGLTETQAQEIRQLQTSLGVKLTDCGERHCAARVRLGKALSSETNSAAQAQALVAEMCRAYEESELATLDHIQRVRELLNPEQKRRFDELITECVCASCAMCGGRVEAAQKVRIAD